MKELLQELRSCRRCGRVLKNPRSLSLGIGPTCLKKEGAEALANLRSQVRRDSLYPRVDC